MSINTLLADPSSIRLVRVVCAPGLITLVVGASRQSAECPRCHTRAASFHSRYLRRVANLPWHGVTVKLGAVDIVSEAKQAR